MASKRAAIPAKHLFSGFKASQQQPCQITTRSMATSSPLPTTETHAAPPSTTSSPVAGSIPNPFLTTATCTLYNFPSLSPTGFATYPSTHLLLPLRKDILHHAVIFEGDATRQGTASTKWRSEVHGSGRKIRPQKGTGSARLGDKKSPMLRGGGVAFGPKPRDFSTELNQKVYDLAFRTALSARYQRGELLVVDGQIDVEGIDQWSLERYVSEVLGWNGLEKSLFVAHQAREEGGFFGVLEKVREARGTWVGDCDVKDLLSGKRVVIERKALEKLFREHQSDLAKEMRIKGMGGNLIEEGQAEEASVSA